MQTILKLIVLLIISYTLCENYCNENHFDSIVWNGFAFEMTRIINNKSQKLWTTTYDNMSGKFEQKFDILSISYFTQSGYFIPNTPECDENNDECFGMQKLKSMKLYLHYLYIGNNPIQYYSIGFGIVNNSGVYFDFISNRSTPFGLEVGFFNQMSPIKFWPNNFTEIGQTYKPAAFWPKQFLFFYIINGRNDSEKSKLITNRFSNNNWTNSWNYKDIKGSEGKRYTAAFWWTMTDTIYVVIENKTNDRNGCVYEFDLEDLENPFKSTGKTVIEFFGCDIKESTTNSVLTQSLSTKTTTEGCFETFFFIIIALYVIMTISFIAICFFVFKKESKKSSPETKKIESVKIGETKRKKERKKKTKSKKAKESGIQSEKVLLIDPKDISRELEEPSVQTLGFEPREEPIGSLKNPIPIEKKN